MNNKAIGSSWTDVRKEIFTPEEILESDLRVAFMGEIIKARHDKGISQKKLEELSGVRQPVIARMERGSTDPKLTTVLKILEPLGMTLTIVPIKEKRMRLKPPFELNLSKNGGKHPIKRG
ncbi:helix-turn-helix domain-containing protein [Acetobacterium wieringae]|uniref:helix-turn-helix domain-containing protein n=1 Tax=Acetobacterium wieringae TaxID=52694 RepID=UPI002B1EC781|nr:helix-turn-helix domain-containing protein [Acetobacterium wieringae]MEA4804777.1 helix-turn-helix domain-containing protein [Acetobacterium wieringae]